MPEDTSDQSAGRSWLDRISQFFSGDPASREDLRIEYSIDDGASWSERPVVQVEVAGETVDRPAPPDAYTHVRWTLTGSVNPGARVDARFRARVAGDDDAGGDA